VTENLNYDHDSTVFQALRIYRNNFLAYCRSRLSSVPGLDVDDEIKRLFQKEWAEIERSADQAYGTGIVDRRPVDALDYLSVNHILTLIEKFWNDLAPDDPKSDMGKRQRAQISNWAKELSGIRNPVAHPPEQELSLRDALRYIDSAARILEVMRIPGSDDLRDMWMTLVAERAIEKVAPPAFLDTLPSREQITTDFVGRAEHLADLWRWLNDDGRRVWALVGDGGKGKTTIAYEFASRVRGIPGDFGLQGVLWLSAKQRRFLEGEVVPAASPDFFDLDSALNWILEAFGWGKEAKESPEVKNMHCIDLLTAFPMLIVADDIDSLDAEDEQAVEFFVHQVPLTKSKVLFTSRRKVFGLGGATTEVGGLTEEEVSHFVRLRAPSLKIDPGKINIRTIRRVRDVTDGSPLYIEDLLRLAQFYSLEHALDQWSGRTGDAAREYSLRRELEKLSKDAVALLGALAYSDSPMSMEECAVIMGMSNDQAVAALAELRNWNLLSNPGLVEDIPRFSCSRNLAKLMRRTLQGTDQERRIRNGLKGIRGVAIASSRVRGFVQQAVALKKANQQDDAERTLLSGLDDVPNSGEIHSLLGWVYSQWNPQPRIADAEENFSKAESLGFISRHLYAHWANMEFDRGEYRNAVKICEKSVASVGKGDPFTWRLGGMSYTRLGQLLRQSLSTEEAAEAFTKARRMLSKAQQLGRERADISRIFTARHELARIAGEPAEVARILAEWDEKLPSDPYHPNASWLLRRSEGKG
jgi:tetratricopeptide (TPR) repeat protein